jgi:hypothetical protein
VDDQAADRLTDLDANRTICMGNDAVKLGKIYRSRIGVEPACALTEGPYRCVDFQFMHDTKIQEAGRSVHRR